MSEKGLFMAMADLLDQTASIFEEFTDGKAVKMRKGAKACRKLVDAAENAQQVAVKAKRISTAMKPVVEKAVEEAKTIRVGIKPYK
jgi:hypothetical protein